MATTPKKRKTVRQVAAERAREPSAYAGLGVLAGVALPGLLTYLQTGSKTQGVIAILAGLAGGAAVVKGSRADIPTEPPAK